MRKISVAIALLALLACGKKDKDQSGSQAGSAGAGSAKVAEQPVTCPPGNAVQDGACVVVVTPEKVAVVAQQQTRLDELAKLLDKVDTVAVPIDLMNGLRQLDVWKTSIAGNQKLQMLDGTVASLGTAVEQLRAFKLALGEASGRLGNLKGELERLLQDTGTAKRIEEVRAQISSQVRTTVKSFADSVSDTILKGLAPLTTRFEDAANLVTLSCAAMALGRAGDKSKQLCEQATTAFAQGKQYLADMKTRPAVLFEEVTTTLETELVALLDAQAKQLLDTTQAAVNEALRLPPAAPGSAGGSSAAPN